MARFLATWLLLGVAFLCCAPLYAAELIPQRIEADVPQIPQRIADCSCPATGICSCAVCDCPDGVKLEMGGDLALNRKAKRIEEPAQPAQSTPGVGKWISYPHSFILNGVVHNRTAAPVAQQPVFQQPALPVMQAGFPAFQGGFTGGMMACAGGR